MADIILPPGVGVTELTIAPWAPGQEDVISPYDPRIEAAGPAATGWTGSVVLAPDPVDGSQDAAMLALRARLRGNRHRVRLPLSRAYRGSTPPDDLTATVTSARIVGDAVRVGVAYVNKGTWNPTDGSFINVGESLYLIDKVEADSLDLIPHVEPLAIRRPRGIFPTPGGGAPAGTDGRGLGTFRGSAYEGAGRSGANDGLVYWVDLATGTRRLALEKGNQPVRALGTAFGYLYAGHGGGGTSAKITLVDIPYSDPLRNSFIDVWTFSDLGSGGSDRIRGLCEWQAPDDSGPKLYVGKDRFLFRSNEPPPLVPTETTFASAFTQVTGPTGFSRIGGLSPGPDGKLWILDTNGNKIYTWDGVVQEEILSGTAGAETGPNVIQLNRCWALEWIDGSLYVLQRGQGTTGAGIARVNVDTPATAKNIEFANPFVWAKLLGGATTGPVGHHFPPTSFEWIEDAR